MEKSGFAEMARLIGQRWKTLPSVERKPFENRAGKEKKGYSSELARWKEAHKLKSNGLQNKSAEAGMSKDDYQRETEGSSFISQMDFPAFLPNL
jgi:hypothetical protein